METLLAPREAEPFMESPQGNPLADEAAAVVEAEQVVAHEATRLPAESGMSPLPEAKPARINPELFGMFARAYGNEQLSKILASVVLAEAAVTHVIANPDYYQALAVRQQQEFLRMQHETWNHEEKSKTKKKRKNDRRTQGYQTLAA